MENTKVQKPEKGKAPEGESQEKEGTHGMARPARMSSPLPPDNPGDNNQPIQRTRAVREKTVAQLKADPMQWKMPDTPRSTWLDKKGSGDNTTSPATTGRWQAPDVIQRNTKGGGSGGSGLQKNFNGITGAENAAVKQLYNVDLHAKGAKMETTSPGDKRLTSVGASSLTQGGNALVGNPKDRYHEMRHMVQQHTQTIKPTTTIGGQQVNNDKKLEADADKGGAAIKSLSSRIASGGPVQQHQPVVQRQAASTTPNTPIQRQGEKALELATIFRNRWLRAHGLQTNVLPFTSWEDGTEDSLVYNFDMFTKEQRLELVRLYTEDPTEEKWKQIKKKAETGFYDSVVPVLVKETDVKTGKTDVKTSQTGVKTSQTGVTDYSDYVFDDKEYNELLLKLGKESLLTSGKQSPSPKKKKMESSGSSSSKPPLGELEEEKYPDRLGRRQPPKLSFVPRAKIISILDLHMIYRRLRSGRQSHEHHYELQMLIDQLDWQIGTLETDPYERSDYIYRDTSDAYPRMSYLQRDITDRQRMAFQTYLIFRALLNLRREMYDGPPDDIDYLSLLFMMTRIERRVEERSEDGVSSSPGTSSLGVSSSSKVSPTSVSEKKSDSKTTELPKAPPSRMDAKRAKKRAQRLADILIHRPEKVRTTVEEVVEMLSDDPDAVKREFNLLFQGNFRLRHVDLKLAIKNRFKKSGEKYTKEYLLLVEEGKESSLLARLLLASGLATGSGTDPEEMVTLIEEASPEEHAGLNSSPLKKDILNRFSKAGTWRIDIGRHKDKKTYVESILQDAKLLREYEEAKGSDPEYRGGLLGGLTPFSKRKPKEYRARERYRQNKVRELTALFGMLRGSVSGWRVGKKLTTPEAEEKIMQWAARQTPEIREYVSRSGGPIDTYLKAEKINSGYQTYIINLLSLPYDKESEDPVQGQKGAALVSYILDKKKTFRGDAIGYWEGIENRMNELDDKGREDFLKELHRRTSPKKPYTREGAIKELEFVLLRVKQAKKSKEPVKRILKAFDLGAVSDTMSNNSPYAQLRNLTERGWLSRKTQSTSVQVIKILSQLKPSEYAQIVNDTKLLKDLEGIFKKSGRSDLRQRMQDILGYDSGMSKIEGIDQEEMRKKASQRAMLRPEHWAAKLSQELERGFLSAKTEGLSDPDTIVRYRRRRQGGFNKWDRNKIFSYINQAYYTALMAQNMVKSDEYIPLMNTLSTEYVEDPRDFMQRIYDLLSDKARITLNEPRLAPALKALNLKAQVKVKPRIISMKKAPVITGDTYDTLSVKHDFSQLGSQEDTKTDWKEIEARPIDMMDRMKGATFRALSLKKIRGRGMRKSDILSAIMDARGKELLEWTNINQLDPDDPHFVFGINPVIYDMINQKLTFSEFIEVQSTLLFRIADAMERDERFTDELDDILKEKNLLDQKEKLFGSYELGAEMLRSKAVIKEEQLNDSWYQYEFGTFSSKSSQRRVALANLRGQLESVREKVKSGSGGTVDVSKLEEARERAHDTNTRYSEMRDQIKDVTLVVAGLALAIAATVATGGLASAGLTTAGLITLATGEGLIVPLSLTAGRAILLEAIDLGFSGSGWSGHEAAFNVIRDLVLSFTTVTSGEISGLLESLPIKSMLEIAESSGSGVLAEQLAANVCNISPVEVTLRTVANSLLEAATSSEHDSWFISKRDMFIRTLVNSIKDGLSKSIYGLMNIANFGKEEAGSTPDITKISQKELALWAFTEMATGQNYAVCEMDTLQDIWLNKWADMLTTLMNKNLSSMMDTHPRNMDDDGLKSMKKGGIIEVDTPEVVDELKDLEDSVKREAGAPVLPEDEVVRRLKKGGKTARYCLESLFPPQALKDAGFSEDEIREGVRQMKMKDTFIKDQKLISTIDQQLEETFPDSKGLRRKPTRPRSKTWSALLDGSGPKKEKSSPIDGIDKFMESPFFDSLKDREEMEDLEKASETDEGMNQENYLRALELARKKKIAKIAKKKKRDKQWSSLFDYEYRPGRLRRFGFPDEHSVGDFEFPPIGVRRESSTTSSDDSKEREDVSSIRPGIVKERVDKIEKRTQSRKKDGSSKKKKSSKKGHMFKADKGVIQSKYRSYRRHNQYSHEEAVKLILEHYDLNRSTLDNWIRTIRAEFD